MTYVQVNGTELYYEVHGRGDAVVFAHGRGGNHLSWWQQIPDFARDRRCIVFDHRSFGASPDAEGLGQGAFADDLVALLDHLGIERADLVAQSMGGRTCLDFALKHPERVRRLVLAGTIAGVVDDELSQLAAGYVPEDLMQRVLSAGFKEREPVLAFLYQEIEALNHISGNPTRLVKKGPGKVAVQACKVPTLLIVGDEDTVAPPQAVAWLARTMPCAELHIMHGAGHSAYFEKPIEFNRLVREFLTAGDAPNGR
jgi:3-oxoadipate enol-lactonase